VTPWRIAIVGAGPAGLYAVGHLLDQLGANVEINVFERLPSPWGLVRNGVAADHPEKKLIIDRQFQSYFRDSRVRFIGAVEIGTHVQHQELLDWHDSVIYAVGANNDVRMGIPGEDLSGCLAAREFVGWCNGHPDFRNLSLDHSGRRAVIVGNGNVALDVARMLTLHGAELDRTDLPDHALQALRFSCVEEVVIVGRRGQAESAFHHPELEELEHLENVNVVVERGGSGSLKLDPLARRKTAIFDRLTKRPIVSGAKTIVFRFFSSVTAIHGLEKVTEVVVRENGVERGQDGILSARATERNFTLPASLVIRAIGYRVSPVAHLPYDEQSGVVCSGGGRVVGTEGILKGVYVTGWAKRGCRGVIGSNKKCARETVDALIADLRSGCVGPKGIPGDTLLKIVAARNPASVSKAGWLAIDHVEREAGRAQSRPRVKIADTARMLEIASHLQPERSGA